MPTRVELRAAGLRATLPRRSILEIVRSSSHHWSVEELGRELAERGVDLPRSSINNVTATLATAGLIRRIDTLPGPARFEADTAVHDHFWCTTCRTISNVVRADVGAIALPGQRARLSITYSGTCSTCAQ